MLTFLLNFTYEIRLSQSKACLSNENDPYLKKTRVECSTLQQKNDATILNSNKEKTLVRWNTIRFDMEYKNVTLGNIHSTKIFLFHK